MAFPESTFGAVCDARRQFFVCRIGQDTIDYEQGIGFQRFFLFQQVFNFLQCSVHPNPGKTVLCDQFQCF